MWENSPGFDTGRIDSLIVLFLDSMGGRAWPFSVGGMICLINSVNERDLSLLNSVKYCSYLVSYTSIRKPEKFPTTGILSIQDRCLCAQFAGSLMKSFVKQKRLIHPLE